jgi:hypothetical protein
MYIFSSPELAQGELLGSVNVRRTSTIACEHTSGHTYDSIIIKLCQDACLVNCSDEFETGSFQMEN